MLRNDNKINQHAVLPKVNLPLRIDFDFHADDLNLQMSLTLMTILILNIGHIKDLMCHSQNISSYQSGLDHDPMI